MGDNDRLIKLAELLRIFSLSRSTVLQRVKDGNFPRPIHIGRNTLWLESEVIGYINILLEGREANLWLH
jgi:prophage regulatory protein